MIFFLDQLGVTPGVSVRTSENGYKYLNFYEVMFRFLRYFGGSWYMQTNSSLAFDTARCRLQVRIQERIAFQERRHGIKKHVCNWCHQKPPTEFGPYMPVPVFGEARALSVGGPQSWIALQLVECYGLPWPLELEEVEGRNWRGAAHALLTAR